MSGTSVCGQQSVATLLSSFRSAPMFTLPGEWMPKSFVLQPPRTSWPWYFIPYWIALSLRGVEFPNHLLLHGCAATCGNIEPLSPLCPTKCSQVPWVAGSSYRSSTLTGRWIWGGKLYTSKVTPRFKPQAIPLLSPASPDFNYLPGGMQGIHWSSRLRSTSPVSCAHFIFLVSHFQD